MWIQHFFMALLVSCGIVQDHGIQKDLFDPIKKDVNFYLHMNEFRKQNLCYATAPDGSDALKISVDTATQPLFQFSPLHKLYISDFDELVFNVQVYIPQAFAVKSLSVQLREPGEETFSFDLPIQGDKTGWQTLSFRADANKIYKTSTRKYAKKTKNTDDGKMDFPLSVGVISGFFEKNKGQQDIFIGRISTEVLRNDRTLRPVLETGNPVHVLSADSNNSPYFRIENTKNKIVNGTLEYVVKDQYGALSDGNKVPVEIASGEEAEINIKRPDKYGVYNIDVTFSEEGGGQPVAQKMSFCHMKPSGPYKSRAEGFLFGVTSHPFCHLTSIEPEALAAALCGIQVLRNCLYWPSCEPQRGKPDYSRLDAVLDEFAKYNIEYQPIIGTDNPLWAKPKDWKPLHPDNPGRNFIPDSGVWNDYLRGYAERYGKKIRYTEVVNEPDLSSFANYSAAEYVQFLRYTYKTLKVLAPEMTIMTGGFANPSCGAFVPTVMNEPNYMRKVLEAAPGSFDVLAYHFHGKIGTYIPHVAALVKLRDELAPGVPIYPNETAVSSTEVSELTQAETLFTKLMYSWAKGAIGYTWYDLRNDGYDETYNETNFGLITKNYYPKPVYGVYNMITGYFKNADFIGEKLKADDVFAYLFKARNGDCLLSNWTNDEEQIIMASGVTGNAYVVDLFGNETPLPVKDANVLFKIGKQPSVIKFSGQNGELAFKPIFTALSAVNTDIATETAFTFKLVNPSKNPIVFDFKTLPSNAMTCSPASANITVPEGSKRLFTTTLNLNDNSPGKHELNISISSPELNPVVLSYLVPLVKEMPFEKFGETPHFHIEARQQLEQLVPNEPGTVQQLWNGKTDLSGQVFLAQSKTGLMVKVVVFDDIHAQKFIGAEFWRGDSVQLLFQIPGQRGQFEFGMSLTDNGQKDKYCWAVPEGFSVEKFMNAWQFSAGHPNATATCYYTHIPFKLLGINPETTQSIRFNVLLNDNDGEIRESQMGIVIGKDSPRYPVVRMGKPSK